MASENKRRPWLLFGLILGGMVAALAALFLVSRSARGKARREGDGFQNLPPRSRQ